jgi:hypothetical protein
VNPAANDETATFERRLAGLATERGELFDKANANGRLTAAEQTRLHAVERELDECFLARRTSRAARDAQRFDHDRPFLRPTLKPRHAP